MIYTEITADNKNAVARLSALASAIVKEYFDPIIGPAQNDHMIAKFQTAEAIAEQLGHGYQYYFVNDSQDKTAGFLAFYRRNNAMYLSKFYLLKEQRGKGIAKDMLQFVISETKKAGLFTIELNVNKNNPALYAYEKMGFVKLREETIDIGDGFVMDDFVYQYRIDWRSPTVKALQEYFSPSTS